LQRLLEDIEARRVDCVLVHRVDRLSRSLLDFARLMDLFDQQKVSFVSVTQQFNTTNSLGRLTLNILFSFAQFERELISERTRDKMSAARCKGKWIGGIPILGYDVDPLGGRLIINDGEAVRVREIFKLYAKHRSIPALILQLQRRRWNTKSWTPRHGIKRIGTPFNKPTLLRLLTNVTYTGKVQHKGTIYPGEQTAIVDLNLWEEINAELRLARRGPNKVSYTRQTGLLSGLLFCRICDRPMVPTYTKKGDRRYRYYICQLAKGRSACRTKSVSARAIEESVVTQLRVALNVDDAREQLGVSEADWLTLDEGNPESLIRTIVERITYDSVSGAVSMNLDPKHT
jgi:site-specific DNA recombinase